MKYLIWSNEHNSWWRPGSSGYSLTIEGAGRYSLAQALELCNEANSEWAPGSRITPDELPIAEEAALLLTCKKWGG